MRFTSIKSSLRLLCGLAALLLVCAADVRAGPIVPDAHTVILDSFEGTTVGASFGTLGFQSSLAGHGQAGKFATGNYVQYQFANLGSEGTIELFVKPLAGPGNADLLGFQWFDATSPPTFGYISHLGFQADRARFSVCCLPNDGFQGISAIPLDSWKHLAVSWGPTGSKLYIDGQIEATTGVNLRPQMLDDTFAYLNYWGGIPGIIHDPVEFDGLVDDLHISNVQRSDAEILAHAQQQQQLPEAGTLALIFAGLGLIALTRRRGAEVNRRIAFDLVLVGRRWGI